MSLAAGIDIGTTSLEILVVDRSSGEVVFRDEAPNQRLSSPEPYAFMQDPDAIEHSVHGFLANAPDGISTIAVTGQVHGILYVDSNGNAVSPLYTWLDQRGTAAFGGEVPSSRLEQRCGRTLPPGYGLLTHYANSLRGEVPETATAVQGISEYITAKLIEAPLTATDSSCLAAFGGWDLERQAHYSGLLDEVFSLRPVLFLDAAPPFSVAGTTADGISVSFAIGDNQAGFLALVADPENECLVSLGTSGQVSVHSGVVHPPEGMESRPFFGKGYLHVGATLCAGKAYELLQRFFSSVLSDFGCSATSDEVYRWMLRCADQGSNVGDDLHMVTTFGGTRSAPDATGEITGITMNNLSPGGMVGACARGIVDEVRAFLNAPGCDASRIRRVIATGNLVHRNPVFVDVLKSRFEHEVVVPQMKSAAAFGAALYGAVAGGTLQWGDLAHLVRRAAVSI